MLVKLLKHIVEGNGIKFAQRRNRDWKPPHVEKSEDGKTDRLVESPEPEYEIVPFVKGTVLDVSPATAEKWIKSGLAAKHAEEKAEAAPQADSKPKPKEKSQ